MQQYEAACQRTDVPTTMQQSAGACQWPDVPTTMQQSEAAYQQTDVPTTMQQYEAACQRTDVPTTMQQSAAACQWTNVPTTMQQSAAAYQWPDVPTTMQQSAAACQWTNVPTTMQQSAAACQWTNVPTTMQQSAAACQWTNVPTTMQQSEAACQWPDVPTTMQQSEAAYQQTDVPSTLQQYEAACQRTDVPTTMQQSAAACQWTNVPTTMQQSAAACQWTNVQTTMQQSAAAYQATYVPSMMQQSAAASQRTYVTTTMQQSAAAFQRPYVPTTMQQSAPAYQWPYVPSMMQQSAAAYQQTYSPTMMQQSAAAYQRPNVPTTMQQSEAAYQRTDVPTTMQQSAAAYQRTNVPTTMQQSAAAYQRTLVPTTMQQSAAAYQRTNVPTMMQQSAAASQRTDVPTMMQQSAVAYQQTNVPTTMQQSAAAYQRTYVPTIMKQSAAAYQQTFVPTTMQLSAAAYQATNVPTTMQQSAAAYQRTNVPSMTQQSEAAYLRTYVSTTMQQYEAACQRPDVPTTMPQSAAVYQRTNVPTTMQQSAAASQRTDVPTMMQQSAAAYQRTDVPTTMPQSAAAFQRTNVPSMMQQPEAAYQQTNFPSMMQQSATAYQRTNVPSMMQQSEAAYQQTNVPSMMQQSAAAYQRSNVPTTMQQSAAAYQRSNVPSMMQQPAAAYQRTNVPSMMQQSGAAYQRTNVPTTMQQSAAAYQRSNVPSMMQQPAAAYQQTNVPSMMQQSEAASQRTDVLTTMEQSAAAYQRTNVPSMMQQSGAAYQWTNVPTTMPQSAAAYRGTNVPSMMQQSEAAYQRTNVPTTMQQEAQVPAALDSPQRSGTIGNSGTISGSNNPIIVGSSAVNINNYNFPLEGPDNAHASHHSGHPSVDISENPPSTSQQPPTRHVASGAQGRSAPKKMKLDSPAQDAADCCEGELKSYYRRKGSFVKLIPWEGDDRKHITEIYTKLQLILGKDKVKKLASYDDILQLETEEGDLILIAVLTGEAGRGKTTLFKKMAYDWAVGSSQVLQKYKLVFLLQMHALEQSSDLVDAVFDQLLAKESIDRGVLDMFIKKSPGKVLVLLDGFDELMTTTLCESSFGSILEILNGKTLRGCTVLVSTRPSHFHRLISEELVQEPFTHVKVLGFSKDDVTEYVTNFFTSEPDKAKGLLEKIESSHLLSSLSESPMLVLLMCVLWREDCTLPETMSRLYHDGFSYIFQRKGLDSQDEVAKVVIEIGKVALHGLLFRHQSLSFKESDFEPSVLELALKAGILTRQRVRKRLQSHNCIQFIHKTFQEFSAAAYLQSLLETDPKEFQKILNKIVTKGARRFEYLLRFCCGDNEACTYEILKVFQVRCGEELSFKSKMGQLALHCYFEGQSKRLPPEEFIHSFISDEFCIPGLHNNRDSLNSVIYFLKCVAEQTKDSGNKYLANVHTLHIHHCRWTWFIEELAVTMCAMTNLLLVDFKNNADTGKLLRHLPNLVPKLDLSGNNLGGTAALWCMHLKQLKSLTKLGLGNCSLNGQDIKHVAESLRDLPNLVELNLSYNDLGGTAALWCMHLKQLKSLTKLALVHCSLIGQDIKQIAESLRDLPNLVELNLAHNKLCGTAALWCMHLKQLKSLTKLSLVYCSLNGHHINHVAESLRDLPNLGELNLSGNNLGGTAALWCMHLKQLKSLTKLSLVYCSLNGHHIKHVAESLRDLPNLGELNLSGNNLGGTAALWCMHLNQLKSLRKLDLGGCSLNGQDIKHVAESLRDLPNLVELDLSRIKLGGTAALWCMHLKQLKSLTKLDLFDCSLNGQDIKHVAESLRDLPNLVELDLAHNNLGGTAALWCMHLNQLKSLRKLDLGGCSLNGQDIKHVAESLRDLPNLVELDLSRIKLGGTAALWCMEVKQLLHLQRLGLSTCQLTEEDKNHIDESLSDLKKNGLVIRT
ncbi:uncharacterized protein LOC119723876 [Patiria miniata]|uniref:NACHT domain-containing protein n=1 Tax=Patiria miniata TaxID=46514 RepID=A0A913ZI17_PATMI|nr:uncharacterized protein LOC119723876 [Patiria miniata]